MGLMIVKHARLEAIVICFVFSLLFCTVQADENQSQCIQCHTNLKKLIRLCWEVEKIKPKAKGSAETSGEG